MCPECSKATSARPAAAFEAALRQINPESPLFAPVLVGLNVLVFAVMVAMGVSPTTPTARDGLIFGANYGPLSLHGQWWRLFTSMFVHFGIIHLGFNMWCLWDIGKLTERIVGRLTFLLAYLATGLAASLASVLWNPLRVSAGASGAIFGIVGVLVAFLYLKKTPLDAAMIKPHLNSLGMFILYNLLFGAARARTDNAAHVGGLVAGLVIGALLPAVRRSATADMQAPIG